MKVLVIGGTQFIGRHVVQAFVEAGHDVSLLNRGRTSPGLFPQLNRIILDRETDAVFETSALKRNWDAVVDLCAYYPRDVRNILEVLNGFAGKYVFCSTISAYQASSMESVGPMIDERSILRACSDAEAADRTLATYGQRKAECERVAMSQHPSGIPVVILRPSIVFGPHDHTDRFAYWIWRAKRQEPFILPDDGLTITRRTFAPDLAKAFVAATQQSVALGNAYNIAETDPLSFRDTLSMLGTHLMTRPLDYAVPVRSETLLKNEIKPWIDLPLWIPRMNFLVDTFRSRRDLNFVSTPPDQALAIAADSFLSENREPKSGLSGERERELLDQLRQTA